MEKKKKVGVDSSMGKGLRILVGQLLTQDHPFPLTVLREMLLCGICFQNQI